MRCGKEVGRVAGASRARGGQWLKPHSRRGLGRIRKNLETMSGDGEAVIPSQGGDTRTSNSAGALVSQIGRVKGLQPLDQENSTC